ncbi:MAG: hypothetical protein KAK04_06685 [Cyclobacteriaceae bacterium]|nr:hypothetical protein [Cyclobacteriaceae bacterium]
MKKKKNINQLAKLTINQDMTIINAGELKAKMEEALNSASSLDLTLKNIEVMDLAGIQLIYALKKEAENQIKKLKINFDLKTDLLENIRLSGFGDLFDN